MSLSRLREACVANKISKVAFIDDVFDPPSAAHVDKKRYAAFIKAMESDETRIRIIGLSADMPTTWPLPGFDDLDDDDLAPYWQLLLRAKLRSGDDDHILDPVRSLFEEHGHNLLEMLETVTGICRLLSQELACELEHFGSRPDFVKLASKDLVLVDFFLEQGQKVAEALESTVGVVRRVKEAATANAQRPAFILVSSRADEVNGEEFRRQASLLRSRFRFIPKPELSKASGRYLLDVHDVIEARSKASDLEILIDDWRNAAQSAADTVREKMLEFDVSDFVYLDAYRLYREGTSLGTYLRWLMTSYLQTAVPDHLEGDLWKSAETLRLFDTTRQPTGQAELDGLVKAFEGPADAIAEAYASVLIDRTRSTATPFPAPIEAGDLLEGDLFVRRSGNQSMEGAEVTLILTPTCDLKIRGGETKPIAETIMMLPGCLRSLTGEVRKDTDLEFVRVDVRAVGGKQSKEVFTIDWHYKAVLSMSWLEAIGHLEPMDRLGRIREPYYDHVRDRFVSQLTRAGWKVGPLVTSPRGGEVYVKIPNGPRWKHASLFKFEAADQFVWAFQAAVWTHSEKTVKARDAGEPKDEQAKTADPNQVDGKKEKPSTAEEKLLFHASRPFLTRLADAVASCQTLVEGRRETLAAKCRSLDFLVALLQPGVAGLRSTGEGDGTFEFALGSDRNCTADVAVVIYKEPKRV